MGRSDRILKLDRENRKLLGVCAGLANYLDVESLKVRLVFLACCMFGGWFLVPLYFIAWFLLDESSASMRSAIADNQTVRHFRTVDYRKKLYRDTERGKILGVCAGLADYLEVSVFAVRLVFLVLLFMTGFPLLFYVGAALVLDKKPLAPVEPDLHAAWQQSARSGMADKGTQRVEGLQEEHFSKRREFQYCARKFAALQTRLARMEAYVTSSRFKLHREFRNIS
jgi:phage shock protein C